MFKCCRAKKGWAIRVSCPIRGLVDVSKQDRVRGRHADLTAPRRKSNGKPF